MSFLKIHKELDEMLYNLYRAAQEITASYAPKADGTVIINRDDLDVLIDSVNKIDKWMDK